MRRKRLSPAPTSKVQVGHADDLKRANERRSWRPSGSATAALAGSSPNGEASDPAPTADPPASMPPATPDAATGAAARRRPDPGLGLLDPLVERAWSAIVERHRARGSPTCSEAGDGGSRAAQKPARQGAAVNRLHRTIPPSGALRPADAGRLFLVGQGGPDRDHNSVTPDLRRRGPIDLIVHA